MFGYAGTRHFFFQRGGGYLSKCYTMHTIKRLNINLRDIFGRKKMGEGMGFSPNGQKIIIASLVQHEERPMF